MRIGIKLLCIIILLFTIANCITETETAPIRISMTSWPGYSPMYIAQEKGIFEKNGVQVEIIHNAEYLDSRRAYFDGESEGILEVYADAIIDNTNGIPTKVVQVIDYSEKADSIVGRPEIKNLSGLKWKKIGIEGINSFSHLFVLTALEKNGIKESEMRFANVPAPKILEALENGEIDAGHTWEPTTSEAIRKGYKVLGSAKDAPYLITDVLAFNEKTFLERPQDIQKIVKSLFEAIDYLQTNRDEALQIVSGWEEISIDELDKGLKGIRQPGIRENINAMKKIDGPESLYSSGKKIAEFMINRGQMSVMPDFDEIIEPKFVNNLVGQET